MEEKHLFIGGSADGKMLYVEHEGEVYWHAIPRPFDYSVEDCRRWEKELKGYTTDAYYPLLCSFGYHKYVIYVLAGLGEDQVAEKLITGYTERAIYIRSEWERIHARPGKEVGYTHA
jgi:hypothetical protein